MTIQVYFDHRGRRSGQLGCFRAKITERPGIHDAGATAWEAVENLLITAKTFGFSDRREDYTLLERTQ